MSKVTKGMIIDTNIWLSEKLLQSEIGNYFLYHLSEKDYSIILPKVVKRELIKNVPKEIYRLIENIIDNDRQLQTFFGSEERDWLDTNGREASLVETRLNEIGKSVNIETIETKPEYFQSILEKEIEGRKTNLPAIGLKDHLIFETALDISNQRTVVLITNDKNFSKHCMELSSIQRNFTHYDSINNYLRQHSDAEELELDYESISRDVVNNRIGQGTLGKYNTRNLRILETNIEAYLSKLSPEYSLSFSIKIEFDVVDTTDLFRDSEKGSCVLIGSCAYNKQNKVVSKINLENEEVIVGDKKQRSIIAYVGCETGQFRGLIGSKKKQVKIPLRKLAGRIFNSKND